MTGSNRLVPHTLGISLLAMLTGWVATLSWSPLVEDPGHYIEPALAAGVLIALSGAAARSLRVSWYVAPLVEIVVCVLFVNHHYAARASAYRFIPTVASVRQVVDTIRLGASDINKYVSPVSSDRNQTYVYLLVGAIGIMLAIDLLACGLGRVPLAGLPILLTLSIPISVLTQGLSWGVFVVTALLFLLLLSTEEARKVLGWGRAVAGQDTRWDSLSQMVGGGSVRVAAVRIGMVTTIGALVLPIFVPVAHNLFGLHGGANGAGSATGVQIVNPLVDLRRDLAAETHTPLVYLTTSDPDPAYLRLTVLDEFTGDVWEPSSRHIPTSNRVSGVLPSAPGVSSATKDGNYPWNLRLADTFDTRWLPTPYPASAITVSTGDWRYDATTFDIIDADKTSTSEGLTYQAVALDPDITASMLNSALTAPAGIDGPMTKLPAGLPPIIRQVAEQVTQGATTEYEKAVKLQDWFRSGGGFTYSTARRPGSGMAELASFITTDKVGYCEQFAAAMAVMGRALGIPSRVSVGFHDPLQVGTSGNSYLFTTDQLHAWPEMYFAGYGWILFEPTPGVHTGAAPAYTRGALTGPSTPTKSPTSQQTVTTKKPTKTSTNPLPKSTGATSHHDWLPVLALVLLLLLLCATPRMLRDARRRSWLAPGQDPPALAAGAWSELQATAGDLGIPWATHTSPRVTAGSLAERAHAGSQQEAELERFVEFVERARYARPFEADHDTEVMVLETVRTWSRLLGDSVRPTRRRFAAIFPRSVLLGRTPNPVVSERAVDERV